MLIYGRINRSAAQETLGEGDAKVGLLRNSLADSFRGQRAQIRPRSGAINAEFPATAQAGPARRGKVLESSGSNEELCAGSTKSAEAGGFQIPRSRLALFKGHPSGLARSGCGEKLRWGRDGDEREEWRTRDGMSFR